MHVLRIRKKPNDGELITRERNLPAPNIRTRVRIREHGDNGIQNTRTQIVTRRPLSQPTWPPDIPLPCSTLSRVYVRTTYDVPVRGTRRVSSRLVLAESAVPDRLFDKLANAVWGEGETSKTPKAITPSTTLPSQSPQYGLLCLGTMFVLM